MNPLQPSPAGLPSGSIGGRRRSGAGAAPWRRLLSAPHRLAFWGGSVMLATSALWWGAALVARAAGLAVPWAVSPAVAHALLLGFGFLPMFMAGLLLAESPQWLGLRETPGRLLALPVVAMLGGWAVALAGFHLSRPLAALGLAAAAVGFALVTGLFGLLVAESRARDRDHAVLALTGCALVVISQWATAVLLVLGLETAARAAVAGALWGGPALVLVVVAQRTVPRFGDADGPALAAWRRRELPGLLALAVAVQAPFAVAEVMAGGRLPAAPAALRVALELPAAALLLWLALRHGLRESLSRQPTLRLLAMLHTGFLWLGVALLLGAVSHTLGALTAGRAGGALSLAQAPLHALAMGCFGSLLLALATRLSSGTSGRPLRVDNWIWLMFWVLQVAVVARVAASLWPPAGTPLTLLAVQFWLAAMGAWAVRLARWSSRARPDGGAG